MMKHLKWLIVLGSLVVLVFLARFLLLFPFSPEDLYVYETPEKADLIVVLEGEFSTRVNQAISLVQRGYGTSIYYPGKKHNINLQQLEEAKEKLGFELFVSTGTESTYEEAIKTKNFIQDKKINRILLVTSPYHSFRASWIFKQLMPGIHFISCPVLEKDSWFKLADTQDKNKTAYRVFRLEQQKFFCYYLAYGWRFF